MADAYASGISGMNRGSGNEQEKVAMQKLCHLSLSFHNSNQMWLLCQRFARYKSEASAATRGGYRGASDSLLTCS